MFTDVKAFLRHNIAKISVCRSLYQWLIPSNRQLRKLCKLAQHSPRRQKGNIRLGNFFIIYPDLLSLYMEFKDIFVNRIYHFETTRVSPYIIDGGGFIGISVLYFKSIYPDAHIVCFEPDEENFKILQSNIWDNHLTNIDIVQAGLAKENGYVHFMANGLDGGKIIPDEKSNKLG
jgi:hypothetical protein